MSNIYTELRANVQSYHNEVSLKSIVNSDKKLAHIQRNGYFEPCENFFQPIS